MIRKPRHHSVVRMQTEIAELQRALQGSHLQLNKEIRLTFEPEDALILSAS